jgi:GT2 family glycosyltransferase
MSIDQDRTAPDPTAQDRGESVRAIADRSVSVVIATYTERRWSELIEAVHSSLTQQPPPTRVVVAVDHNEPLLERVRAELPQVRAVRNRYARGASGTRNSGVDVVDTELVAFIDDDEVATPGWLARLVAAFADPAVVGVGGSLVPIWSGRPPGWFPDECGWAIGVSYRGMPTTDTVVRNVWSANMAVRHEAFRRVGGFRVGFGKLADRSRPEDTELCIRMAAAAGAGRWMYVPDAVVGHHVPADRMGFGFLLRRSYHEGYGKVEMARLLHADTARPTAQLDVERDYVRRTLPRGVARGLHQFVTGADRRGATRASAIVAGMTAAAFGVVRASLAARPGTHGRVPAARQPAVHPSAARQPAVHPSAARQPAVHPPGVHPPAVDRLATLDDGGMV